MKYYERGLLIWKLTTISPTEKLVLLALNQYADSSGKNCFPSTQKIATDTCFARPTVSKTLSKLADRGLIFVSPRYLNGRQTSNDYQINYSAIQNEVYRSEQLGVTEDYSGVTDDYSGCNGGLQRVSSTITAGVTEDYTDQFQLTDQLTDQLIANENFDFPSLPEPQNPEHGDRLIVQSPPLPVTVGGQGGSTNGAELKTNSLRNSKDRSSITQENYKGQGSGEKAKIQREAPPSAAAPPHAAAKRSTDMGSLMGKRTDHRAIAANYISLFNSEQEEDDFYRWAIAYLKNQGDSQPEKSADIAVMCLKTAHKASPRHKEMLSSFRENPASPEAKTKSTVMGDIEGLQQLAKQNPLEARQRAIALAKSKGYPENFFILRAKLDEL